MQQLATHSNPVKVDEKKIADNDAPLLAARL